MKLQPQLVPKPLWGISGNRLLSADKWQAIRRGTLTVVGNQCSVCGSNGNGLECHEHWDYDDKKLTATLDRLMMLCPNCHTATHMGRAMRHGLKDVAVAQLCRVNGCSPVESEESFKRAMAVWRRRSGYDWTTFVSDDLRTLYPALLVLHKREVVNTLQPSEETAPFFLWAFARGVRYPAPTERSGKWLLFVRRTDVDEVWPKIREALNAGKLGASAKVSTARRNPNSPEPNRHVVCVYTYDSDDVADVERIRASLRELGFTRGLSYKTDAATDAGRYRVRGHRKVSKYSP